MSNCSSCTTTQPKMADYASENIFTWCTNCGNYGITAALKRALVSEQISPCHALLCFDIGCNGNGSDKIGGYRFHGLHGRVISFACGAAAANSRMKVVASAGDGATFGEGIGHLIHAIRGNFNVTFLFHNNLNYGLTQGQASPTTKQGMKMNSAPDGITSEPVHPMRFVLSLMPTFAARTFSGDVKHMTEIFRAGLNHPGFSFIEVLQSCPTYNKATPHEWYQERAYDVSSEPNYDPTNWHQALEVSEDLEERIALGVLFRNPHALPFMKRQANRQEMQSELVDEVRGADLNNLLEKFR
jgi:2-oxoglutarate/2-oxoacid ferredoxin oxidoreductase subunit beta